MISSTTEVCAGTGSCSVGCSGTCATADGHIDEMVSTAITELKANKEMAGEVAYDASTNKITVTLTAEAGVTKEIEVPIQKWGVADFFAKVSLTVEGSLSGLTTTQAVDLCMKSGGTEICGADIPKCDDTDRKVCVCTSPDPVAVAQKAICTAKKQNWHALMGAPPVTMFPPQSLEFTDACKAATGAAPPPPPTVTLTMQASGSVSDYADSYTKILKFKIGIAACTMKNLQKGKDCKPLGRGVGLKDYDSAIAVTITAASVIITAVITASSNSAAAELSDSLKRELSTAEAASTELGITVEATPTVVVYAPESSSSSADGGAIAGAVISVLLFIGTIGTIVYLVKKERIANPLDRLKEKLGKRKVYVMENGANAELAAAKPA